MQQSVKDRVRQFIKAKGINERRFCQMIGVSPSYVSSMRKSIQPDKISSIAEAFPDLNTGWLLTGDGDMMKVGDVSFSGNASNKGIVGNAGGNNIVNNVNAYGYEKIIKPDGTLVLELAKPNSKNVVGAQEIVMEYNTLQAKIKLLEEKCAAKDETIQALKITVDVLSSKANK